MVVTHRHRAHVFKDASTFKTAEQKKDITSGYDHLARRVPGDCSHLHHRHSTKLVDDQALGRLVRMPSTHCCAYRFRLSTWFSTTGLTSLTE